MTDNAHLHRAINSWARHERWLLRRLPERARGLPFGQVRTSEQWAGRGRPSRAVTVRCLDIEHPYVMASVCRVNRTHWHNRVHHARARWVATDDRGGLLELGQTWCGRTLSNPLYADLPRRDCGPDLGAALLCPQCELAFHPEGLVGACQRLLMEAAS